MGSFDAGCYGPAVAAVLQGAKLNALGAGSPDTARREALSQLTPEAVVAPHTLASREMAAACLAGLWLRHDFLDESHRISQDLGSSTGSFWHAIMHRREGDFDNAKYWFRRVGEHSVFAALGAAARKLVMKAAPAKPLALPLAGDSWDPFCFVDVCCDALRDSSSLRELCMQIQQAEWELLFDDCYRRAVKR